MSTLIWNAPNVLADPAGYEPNDSFGAATEIFAGYYENLAISSTIDKDYYNITLLMGANISVTICNMIQILQLVLYNTTGGVVDYSNEGYGNSQKVWWFNVPDAGNYTILVTPGYGPIFGPYDMRIETPVIDDSREENDDLSHATAISCPCDIHDLQIYDNDFYKVQLSAGQYVKVTIWRSAVEADSGYVTFQIQGSMPWAIEYTTVSAGGSHTYMLEVSTTGYYYFSTIVTSKSWGNYSLSLEVVADDAFEDNDAVGQATPIDLDNNATIMAMAQNLNLILEDTDWYQFPLNANETVYAVLGYPLNVALQITNTIGVLLAEAVPTPALGLITNCTVPKDGTYKVRVHPTASPHMVPYGLILGRLNVTHPADITYQPGETNNTITWQMEDSFFNMWPYSPELAQTMVAKVYMDGLPFVDEYMWNRTNPVSMNVDGLPEGTYTFKIVAKNLYNATVEDTIIVTVRVAPSFFEENFWYLVIGGIGLIGIAILIIGIMRRRKRRMAFRN